MNNKVNRESSSFIRHYLSLIFNQQRRRPSAKTKKIPLDFFNMDFKFAGKAIMINNFHFNSQKLPDLDESDARRNIDIFETSLGKSTTFNTEVHTNQTRAQIIDLINLHAHKNYTDYACLLLCVITHGNRAAEIYASDQKRVQIVSEIIERLCENETLVNKPKIFLFECSSPDSDDHRREESLNSLSKSKFTPERAADELFIPSNCYIGHSIVDNYKSYAHRMTGSYFVYSFFEIFNKFGHVCDLNELEMLVLAKMKEDFPMQTLPYFVNRLLHRFSFVKVNDNGQIRPHTTYNLNKSAEPHFGLEKINVYIFLRI
jgi:hypothetical protein